MINSDDATMDDVRHPDPLVDARLQSFPASGAERHSLETWVHGTSKAAQSWAQGVQFARIQLQVMERSTKPITDEDLDWIRDFLKCFKSSALGREPEVLKILSGDPKEYKATVCSGPSLTYLLRGENKTDILIGAFLLSKVTDASQAESQLIQESIRSDDWFTRKYSGPGAMWLEKGLRQYIKMYDRRVHYGKMIFVLQSSGTGKSRVVDGLARSNSEEHWGVTVCFRGFRPKKNPSPHDGWPLGDAPVLEFLSSPSIPADIKSGSLKGEEIAAAFIGACFSVLHDTIVDARRGRSQQEAKKAFDSSWSIPDVTRPADSPRNDNFEKVRIKANILLNSHAQKISEARNLMPYYPQEDTSNWVFPPKILGFAPWVAKLYSILVDEFAKELDEDRRALGLSYFTLTFDEPSFLNFDLESGRNSSGNPVNRISLLAMQRIIKACDGLDFWFFMPDTTCELHGEFLDKGDMWNCQGTSMPLPPWPYLPFNVMVPPPECLPNTPLEALRLDRLQVYGRPLWSTYRPDELMVTAAEKLVCEIPELALCVDNFVCEKVKLQVLALHSTRCILNLRAGSTSNTMAIASVKGHLRVLTHYDSETRMVMSEMPSEPILAIAAGKFLLDDKDKYKRSMQVLVQELLLSDEIIHLGDKWETLARIALVVSRDATVHAAGGQICILDAQKITEQKYHRGKSLEDNLHYAVRPFTLDSYLRKLVNQDKVTQVGGAFDSGLTWATEVHMNFTHFVQLDDFAGPYLSHEFLIMCWRRGLALQCIHNQPIADMLLVGYRGDLSKPFDPKMFVFVVLQVRNQVKAAGLNLINTITCPFVKFGSEYWKPEYMVILMDMCAPIYFEDTGRQVHVTKHEAVGGEAWSAFKETEEYAAVRINILGFEPYLSLVEWAPAMLDLRHSSLWKLASLSTLNDTFQSSVKVTKGALTLSSEELKVKYEKWQKGENFDVNDV